MNLNTAQAVGLLISILGIAVLAVVTGMRRQQPDGDGGGLAAQ